MSIPQLSVPRAGHTIITMDTASRQPFCEEDEDMGMDAGRTLLVFGGGDNEGNFYSDLMTVAVKKLLTGV